MLWPREAKKKPGKAEQSQATAHPTSMAEVRVSEVSAGFSPWRGRDTTATFQDVLFMVFVGTANNSQGAVYQQHSPAPPSNMTGEIPAKTYMGTREMRLSIAM